MRKFVLTLCLLTVILSTAFAQPANDPVANPKSIVQSNNARFTVLTDRLVRLEWAENATFTNKASQVFLNRNLPKPNFKSVVKDGWLYITTDYLTLKYKEKSGKFTPENLSITFNVNGEQSTWKPGMENTQNLKGTTRTLDGVNGLNKAKIRAVEVHLEDGLLSKAGWNLVDDSESLVFDGNKEWEWVAERKSDNTQDWYFFGYGHDYKAALHDYTKVAGKIPMIPKYAFGYWWSRYWMYSDKEIRELVNDFETYQIPIDVFVIDMDWHETWTLLTTHDVDEADQLTGWTGYTWNRNLFPEPEKLLEWLEEKDLKTALNLHPASGIEPFEEPYDRFAKAINLDPNKKERIPYMMHDKKWANAYFDEVLRPLEKQGVDFWWLDWQQWQENKFIKGLNNTWWLNYTFFTDMERNSDSRPILFHRWGGLGNHRYQIGFSGDSFTTWESLAYLPYFTATASNVGYGYWSHDIGGHQPRNSDPELYLRWIQYGVFSPILRTHTAKSEKNERRIWKYGDHFEYMHNALKLRYALNPYIYDASRTTYDTGISICRPMYYDYPEKQQAYDMTQQYMFGDDMLIAPVVSKSDSITALAKQNVWLPEGSWYDWAMGTTLKGNQVLEQQYTLDEVPVFVKSGSIIPMYPEVRNLQNTIDHLNLAVIPGAAGSYELYEDDGNSKAYENDAFTTTTFEQKIQADGSKKVTIFARKGKYDGMLESRTYTIQFLTALPPAKLMVNGKEYTFSYDKDKQASWWYDGLNFTVNVNIPKTACDKQLDVVFVPAQKWEDQQKTLAKLKGRMALIDEIGEKAKLKGVEKHWLANIPKSLIDLAAWQVQFAYDPSKVSETIKAYPEMVKQANTELKALEIDQNFIDYVDALLNRN